MMTKASLTLGKIVWRMQPKMKIATTRRITTAATSGNEDTMVSLMLTKTGNILPICIKGCGLRVEGLGFRVRFRV